MISLAFLKSQERDRYTYTNLLPTGRIPEKINSALAHSALHIDGTRICLVAGQPAPFELVVPPFAAHQLLGYQLLHDIPRHAVEDVEKGLIAEARDARLKWLNIGNIVASRQREILFQRDC
jgi:hypothetical protein